MRDLNTLLLMLVDGLRPDVVLATCRFEKEVWREDLSGECELSLHLTLLALVVRILLWPPCRCGLE